VVPGGDGARIAIERKRWWGWSRRTVSADANGFFGAVYLPPGAYRVKIPGRPTPAGPVRVEAGKASRVAP
jgi:hypothetical protein